MIEIKPNVPITAAGEYFIDDLTVGTIWTVRVVGDYGPDGQVIVKDAYGIEVATMTQPCAATGPYAGRVNLVVSGSAIDLKVVLERLR